MTATNALNISMLPDVGENDWKFAFHAGLVRSMETSLLSAAVFGDMAAAADLSGAVEMLSGTEYTMPQSKVCLADIEKMLADKKQQLAAFFADLLRESPVCVLPAMLADMSNLRLAIRRFVTERPIGTDYCPCGSQNVNVYEAVFGQNDYSFLPVYMQRAIEDGILAYYSDKDIRAIDYAVDQRQFDAIAELGRQAGCPYLCGLASVQADLTNIKTILRKKIVGDESLAGLLSGGYIDTDKLKAAALGAQEQFSGICFATPYGGIIDAGIDYLVKQNSFLKLEAMCDKYLADCCDMAGRITAGIQPVIAYFYKKSDQIRKVRMVLTAKSNRLDKQLILDRLGA